MSNLPSQRGSANERGYNYRWQKARQTFLSRHPLCSYCIKRGVTQAATVLDHIIPHRGDSKLFWDTSNWQSLCKTCHDSVKQAEESNQQLRGAGADGVPLDPRHHWNS